MLGARICPLHSLSQPYRHSSARFRREYFVDLVAPTGMINILLDDSLLIASQISLRKCRQKISNRPAGRHLSGRSPRIQNSQLICRIIITQSIGFLEPEPGQSFPANILVNQTKVKNIPCLPPGDTIEWRACGFFSRPAHDHIKNRHYSMSPSRRFSHLA